MQVTSTTTAAAASQTQNAASAAATQTGKTLDYNAFLQLLVAELKHQDPTKPMDSAQYIGQLASFSNVEQSVKLNTKLDALLAAQAVAQADSLIGHTVTAGDGSVSGVVEKIRITDAGAVAILTGGTELAMGPGVTVSAP